MSRVGDIFRNKLSLAVKKSVSIVTDEAKQNHRYKARTGNIERSINSRFGNNGLVGLVYINDNIANYAPFVHEGYRAHIIRPKNKKALRWVNSNNNFVFAKGVKHPGWRKDPFIYNAFKNNEVEINKIFSRHVDEAIEVIISDITSE